MGISRFRTAGGALALAVLVVACNGTGNTADREPPPAASPSTTASPTTQTTFASTPLPDACTLVDQQSLDAIFGSPSTQNSSAQSDASSTCTYENAFGRMVTSEGRLVRTVQVRVERDADSGSFKPSGRPDFEPRPGIGDQAYIAVDDQALELGVRKHGLKLSIIVASLENSDEMNRARAGVVTAAKVAAARL